MKILTKEEFFASKKKLIRELEDSIFIHPTDSSYCLACNATNEELVKKLREIKKSTTRPFSIIIPSKSWI